MGTFVVALRAASAVRLPENHSVETPVETPNGTRRVVIRTAYEGYGSGAVPRAIWFEVTGVAPSLMRAREEFQSLAEALANRICLAMASSIDALLPFVAFDASPESQLHQYWQFVADDERGYPRPSRLLDDAGFSAVLAALEGHPRRDALERALAAYREAMHHVVPGEWLLALAWGWIGFEAIKQVALEQELQRRQVTKAELASDWNVTTSVLANEARRRLFFSGQYGLHDRARATSNDLEHALQQVGGLYERAEKDAIALVAQLRRGLLRCMFRRVPRLLTQRKLSKPFPCAQLQHFIGATFVGDASKLAEAGLPYPRFDVTVDPTDVQLNADGTYDMTHQTTITVRMGPGVSATDITTELWGASNMR